MKVQFENKVMSSLLLFVDHEVTQQGDAYTNHQSNFFKIDSLFSDYYVYATPFKQLVSDGGITGASTPNLLTGVYVDGDGPIGPGTSGLHSINHMQGQAYFTGATDPMSGKTVSGRYAVKDFNVFLTSLPEEQLLFETKLVLNPKTSDIKVTTGVDSSSQTYPAIFIKDNGGRNEEFAMGGIEDTLINARAIILADSLFNLDAACGILKDTVRKKMSIIDQTDLNLNALGGYTGVTYNYTGVATGDYCYIDDVTVSKNIANRGDFQNLNPNVFSAFVDFELHSHRMPRG
jgi:hypothetical protein|tara:strand:+ start:54 stop:920 length:867 start_codon:yes stop_codon:yes gene_type:complete